MNVKTTFALAGVLIVIVAAFWLINPEAKDLTKEESDSTETSKTSQPLFEKKFDEVVKMTVARPGKETLVFEKPPKKDKPDEYDSWRVVEPVKGKAVTWEVNSLADKVNGLKYVKKYAKGSGDIDDKRAGLDSPRAEITIAGKEGEPRTVLIGKGLIIGDDTYVRIKGEETTHLVDADFKDNLKKKLKDFRDRDMVDFTTDEAVRVEIGHEGKKYTLVKTDDKWTFESPFRGDADKSKITSLLSSVNSLRADEWLEAADAKGGGLGFEKPALTLAVTTEHKVKKAKKAEDKEAKDEEGEKKEGEDKEKEAKQEEEEIVTETIKLEFGGWADFGKKEKIYGRVADQPAVAIVTKSNYENLIPKVTEWRDLAVTKADMLKASKIALTYPKGAVALVKKGGAWQFEGGGKAERGAVDDLLRKLKGLKATKFIDGVADAGKYGLTTPRVQMQLTIEGQTDPEVIQVGGKSSSGLMGYVRRGQDGPVAVVKEGDLEPIIKPAAAYRDRSIFDLIRSRVKKLELTRTDPATGKKQSYALAKVEGEWTLSKPAGEVDDDGIDDLLSDVVKLRAKTAVGEGEGNVAAYGLDKPAVRLVLHEEIPPPPKPASRPTTQPASQPASQVASKPAKAEEPPAKPKIVAHVLLASKKDDKAYAKKAGSDLVYEIDTGVFDHLLGELVNREFWKVESSQVTGVSVVVDGKGMSFEKKNDQWTHVEDADVPIDGSKVDDHVKAIAELKAERYADYAAKALAAYELDKPAMVVKVTLDDKSTKEVRVSAEGPTKAFKDTKYATLVGGKKVFLVKNESLDKLKKKLTDFEKKGE